jgi:DNA-binding GntR family transcriptional regulator
MSKTTEIGEAAAKETLASSIHGQLRQDILSLTLAPESKLNIRALSERFEVGLSPVREALSRLSTEGLVHQSDHRGFKVVPLSLPELDDLTRTRCSIDGMGLRESIEKGGSAWEESLLLAFHRLSRAPRFIDNDTRTRTEVWEEAHRQFHRELIAGASSPWLSRISAQLFQAAERYRHVARIAGKLRTKEDEHTRILDAALARDADKAVRLLAEHYRTTAAYAKAVLAARS